MELFHLDTGAVTPPTQPATETRDYWQALRDEGYVELIRDPAAGATLGYADPVLEIRNGRQVAVAYALGTLEERREADRLALRDSLVVSPFQARAALASMGLLEQVEALMLNPETPEIARLAWLHAQEFRRWSPTVLGMAQALELDDNAIDNLFLLAQEITA